MDLGIQGKRALVCASTKGLGKAIAATLAKEGAELFLCARTEADLKVTADELQAFSQSPIRTYACDMAVLSSREALIAQVKSIWDSVDILIHNAGGPSPSTVQATTLDAWQRGFETNFLSIAHLNQAFLPAMKANQWGRIVTVTSLSPMEPIADLAVSNSIRAAVVAMMKTLSNEVAANNITVNCVAPGIIYTDRIEALIRDNLAKHGGTREQLLTGYTDTIPAKRLGTPEEYAAMVAFLCSTQASYITGNTVTVDGGKRKAVF